MLGEGFRADPPDVLFMSCFGRSRRQITEHLPASIFDHPFRHIQNRGKYAAHGAIVVPNRAVRKGEIALFEVVVTVDREHLAGEMTGLLSVCHNSVEPWPEEIPGLWEAPRVWGNLTLPGASSRSVVDRGRCTTSCKPVPNKQALDTRSPA